jgi:hypothetical protein
LLAIIINKLQAFSINSKPSASFSDLLVSWFGIKGCFEGETGRLALVSMWPPYGLYTTTIRSRHGHHTASTRPPYSLRMATMR